MIKQTATGSRRGFKRLAYLIIAVIIAYVFLPFADYAVYSYFACDTRCSSNLLIQAPWMYHSRKVRVFGFINLRFEGNALYSSQEYSNYRLYGQAIWIDADKKQIKQYKDNFNSKYVIITANFDSIDHGHGNLFAGSLKNIEKIEIASNYKSQ